MSPEDTIRAWKDAKFRQGLSAEERALLPDNPVGFVELSEADLGLVAGANETAGCTLVTEGCSPFTDGCSPFTQSCYTTECTENPFECTDDIICASNECTVGVCGMTSYSCQSNDVPRCSFVSC
jgi:mersacidin/lichenicidin family type 2 lantibiotic